MADARALLKAKRQEARISHPFAAYNSTGQLRCSVCGTIVKHASAWEGHLGSKIHRTNVARAKEEKQRQELEQEQESKGKRKADEETSSPQNQKKQRVEESSTGFPDDFFSDPSRTIPVSSGDSDDDEDAAPTASVSQLAPTAEVDLEYKRFQQELHRTEGAPQTYDGATVAAEPVLVSMDMDGFPVNDAETTEAPAMTEGELRAKKEQEERELIMDRLLDEERAQEEADARVNLIRARFEVLKKKREQKGGKGTTNG